jgi:hypothetical protein
LTGLAIEIVEIGEGAQGPEILPNIADTATLDFAFLPTRCLITGARYETEFVGEGKEPRLEGALDEIGLLAMRA